MVHLFPKVCSIGGHGALIHSTWTVAQTGKYSIVHAVGSSHGLPVLTCDPVLVAPHSPLIYARSSHDVPSGKLHIAYCPPVHSSISSVHELFVQFTDAGLANPTVPVVVPVAY